jgi:tetratricopeptide (TPR) repeat protein
LNKKAKFQKTKSRAGAVSLQAVDDLISKIRNPFLQKRTVAYVLGASEMLNALESDSFSAGDLDYFAKQARVLDLIFSVSMASNYLAPEDASCVESIRHSFERRLAKYVRQERNGVISIAASSGQHSAKIQSSMGRNIAQLFARVVPPSAQKQYAATDQTVGYLPDDIGRKLVHDGARANLLFTAQNYGEAINLYQHVLGTDRKNAAALRGLAQSYLALAMTQEAIRYHREALLLFPDDGDLLTGLGYALIEMREYDEARTLLQKALKLEPKNVSALVNLSLAHLYSGEDQAAKASLDKAAKLSSGVADVNLAIATYHAFHHDWANASLNYAKVLQANPRHAAGLNLMGVLRRKQQKVEEALDLIDRSLKLQPENVTFLWNKAITLLSMGKYAEGWPLHEHGLTVPTMRNVRFTARKPLWKGEQAPNKKLLIVCEQGLGDSLQFVRYAALCKKRVGKVYVLCAPPLVRLFKNCPEIDGVFTKVTRCAFDLQVAMMSLPGIMGTTLETIPAAVPYLFVPKDIEQKWASRIAKTSNKLKVGLVWSGSSFADAIRGDLRAQARNLDFGELMPLLNCPNVDFYSLQFGEKGNAAVEGGAGQLIDPMKDVSDFLDTAALIKNLDLVITVDTSVAHLAGALGKNVWIMSRYDACWRWLNNQSKNPWYPTARIFGQPKQGDWVSVIAEVKSELSALSSS